MQQSIVDESLLRRAHEHALQFLRTLPERHVGARATREELLALFRAPLSDAGEPPEAVLDVLARGAERGVVGVRVRATSASSSAARFPWPWPPTG